MHTSELASVTSRFNPKTTMLPVGAVNRRARRIVCRLTGRRGVDMKYESHIFCAPHQSMFSVVPPLYHTLLSGAHLSGQGSSQKVLTREVKIRSVKIAFHGSK